VFYYSVEFFTLFIIDINRERALVVKAEIFVSICLPSPYKAAAFVFLFAPYKNTNFGPLITAHNQLKKICLHPSLNHFTPVSMATNTKDICANKTSRQISIYCGHD